jgi:hypothetical protein
MDEMRIYEAKAELQPDYTVSQTAVEAGLHSTPRVTRNEYLPAILLNHNTFV